MRLPRRRRGEDLQLRAADFLQVYLQLLRRQLRHPRRFFRDDDLRAGMAVLDEEGVGGVQRGERRE
jgi:hypothetical protein